MADDKLFPHKTSRGESLGRRGGIAKRHIRIGAIGYSELNKDLAFDLSFARTQAEVVRAAKEVWDRAAAITEDGRFLVERLQGFIERNQLSLDVRQELDDAASRLNDAESRLDDAESRINDAVSRIDDASNRIDNAVSRLSEAEQRLFGVEDQVENIETSIEELEDKIVLKVDKEELDALANRVVDVETELSVQAGEIQLRATKEELDALTNKVLDVEAELSVQAGEIALRATKEELDVLTNRVVDVEAELSVQAGEIELRATREELNALTNRVVDVEAELSIQAGEIELRATKEELDALANRVVDVEAEISVHAGEIQLRATKEELDALANRVVDVEAELSVHAGEIQLRATKEELNTLELRVQEAEAQLSVHAGEIAAKVNRSEFDLLSGQVATNTANISATADLISSEIARIEANLNSTNRELWYSSIRQTADLITSEVSRIEETLNGSNPELWYSSVKQAWDRIESTVAVLNLDADHPQQFSSIKQAADEISSIVTTLNEKSPTDAGQFSSIRQTADQIASVVATLEKDPHDTSQYSSIRQTADQIASVVATLEKDPHDTTQYSSIRQMAGEIDLRVRNDQVISAINISPEEVKIQANRVMIGSPAQGLSQGAHLFHFDNSLQSTRGLRPLTGYVATLRPGEGRFAGAVVVEEGTTNLVPSNRLKFEGWTAFSGAQVTLTQNVEFPEIGRNDATRIRTTGGTSTLKYYISIERSIADQAYTGSVYIKNIGSKPVRFRTQLGPSVTVNPGEWTRAIASGVGNGTSQFQLRFEALNVDDDLDFIAWGPQAEYKPFATSFVDGTRAAGRLSYPVNFNMDEGTIRVLFYLDKSAVLNATTTYPTVFVARQGTGTRNLFWVYFGEEKTRLTFQRRTDSGSTSGGYVHLSNFDELSDGWHDVAIVWSHASGVIRVYLDGEFKGTAVYNKNDLIPLDTVDVGYRQGASDAGNMLIDELLILPYAASDEEIRTWYELKAPFYDTDDRVAADLPGGHVITFDSSGMQMTPAGFPQRGMHLNGRMIGFWDINNIPSIGIGDVREMAAQLGSTMEYGLLLNQGEIRASQSVLQQSFVDASVTRDAIAPGAVVGDAIPEETIVERQIAERSVGISRLGEEIMVPNIFQPTLLRYQSNSETSMTLSNPGQWVTLTSWSVPKRDNNNGYLMEVGVVSFEMRTDSTEVSSKSGRLLINGQSVLSFTPGNSYDTYGFTLDARTLPDGNVNFALEGRYTTNVSNRRLTFYTRNRRVYQNEQLPLRWGRPRYTITSGASGCYTGCQVTCQGSCQATCQSGCQSSCQSSCQASCQGCQVSCQSTCQKTSQGGGGCLREGTPVTIWDPDVQEYREIPVEQLQPGMVLPGYDPETDTVIHGELIELEDALFSNRFIRIHTDVGPSIDVTYSQPFDVMADVGQGWRWYKVQARFLKPGMKMVRPFDDPEKRIATITEVEEVREYMVHFWHPRTTTGRYTAAGYADQYMKW